jgi:hypothetical protein
MSYQDREEIVSVVQETYALVGRALSTQIPGDVAQSAVRPEIMQALRDASIDPYVTDPEMLELLRTAYFDLVDTVLRIQAELLGENGESYEVPLAEVQLTGSGRVVKVNGFRRALNRLLGGGGGTRGVKKAFQWGNIILGSLGAVPVVGAFADGVSELKESVEAQGDDDQSPA